MSEDRSRADYKSGKSLRILVVEDHSDTLQALSRLLNYFGHDISTADDARSALNMINSKQFDVVLCDIALPDGNGYDVIVEAKRKGAVKAVAIWALQRVTTSSAAEKPDSISIWRSRWIFTNCAAFSVRSRRESVFRILFESRACFDHIQLRHYIVSTESKHTSYENGNPR